MTVDNLRYFETYKSLIICEEKYIGSLFTL